MSDFAYKNSSQATMWAMHRKEAMEKAKKTREDIKYGFARTGEMAIEGNYHPQKNSMTVKGSKPALSGHIGTIGSASMKNPARRELTKTYNPQLPPLEASPVSQEDAFQAASALRLLKSKMTKKNNNTSTEFPDALDALKEVTENTKLYLQERTMERNDVYIKGKADHDHLKETLNRLNQQHRQQIHTEDQAPQGSQGNKNYRKVFKPMLSLETENNSAKEKSSEPQFSSLQRLSNKFEKNQRNSDAFEKRKESMNPDGDGEIDIQNLPSRLPKMVLSKNKENDPPVIENSYAAIYRASKLEKNPKRERESGVHEYGADSPYNKYEPLYKKPYQPSQYYNSEYDSVNSVQHPERIRNEDLPIKSQYIEEERALRASKPDNFTAGRERPNENEELVRCPAGCGRKFFESIVEKHAKTCKQVFQHKRDAFDTASHRMTEDQKKVLTTAPTTTKTVQVKKPEMALKKMPKWKQQSFAFRAAMKGAKGESLTNDEQFAIVTNQKEGFVQCEFCSRKFNEKAAERHIPFCQSKQKKEALKRPTKGKLAPLKKYEHY